RRRPADGVPPTLVQGTSGRDRNLRTGKMALTPELEALLGLEPGSMRCYADFRAQVHPDDIAAYEAERDTAIRHRETFEAEYRVTRPDGQVRWMVTRGGATNTPKAGLTLGGRRAAAHQWCSRPEVGLAPAWCAS